MAKSNGQAAEPRTRRAGTYSEITFEVTGDRGLFMSIEPRREFVRLQVETKDGELYLALPAASFAKLAVLVEQFKKTSELIVLREDGSITVGERILMPA